MYLSCVALTLYPSVGNPSFPSHAARQPAGQVHHRTCTQSVLATAPGKPQRLNKSMCICLASPVGGLQYSVCSAPIFLAIHCVNTAEAQ